jgi:hypothetical protein
MNSYGHAWVAGWFSDAGPFILGAMLPDLTSALRVAPPAADDAELDAGIRLHHATDSVFHQATAFTALENHARETLAAAGLAKGPRRALAHIAVEFLLDEQLASAAPAWTGYDAALAFGSSDACRGALRWSDSGTGERFAGLCRSMAAHSPRRADDRRLAARLAACLSGRPRLELRTSEVAKLVPWLAECRPLVAAQTPSLLAELSHGLPGPSR